VQAAGARYAVPAAFVREITSLGPVTRWPGAPAHVRGLANLRGVLVPVLDLGHRLSGVPATSTEPAVVVVEAETRLLGVLVDEVHEVLELDVFPAPGGPGPSAGLVAGLGHFADAVVIVADGSCGRRSRVRGVGRHLSGVRRATCADLRRRHLHADMLATSCRRQGSTSSVRRKLAPGCRDTAT
jgi:purine-binding chemotaxis protein CheW